ncbi:hypothetical protein K504DRAFT_506309 [Pleomassaria siparia CBS 279.74]|uniref:Fungal N-terminal domain-containing protein n=1 Tax=Pleomassaria siparia CBS 279.74 TaxID=1314801 RepID=A0A6G1JXU5_9PLEO|nr:hypothetical protein K504DRAFT_506309 [Pleomassaria siparia CBS 279.74]
MAEPFSVAVGILSVIKAARTVYVIARTVKNAKKELEPLLEELDAVEKAVDRIQERFKIDRYTLQVTETLFEPPKNDSVVHSFSKRNVFKAPYL